MPPGSLRGTPTLGLDPKATPGRDRATGHSRGTPNPVVFCVKKRLEPQKCASPTPAYASLILCIGSHGGGCGEGFPGAAVGDT